MSYFNDRYINPLTDFGFKKLFGSEPNKDLLIDFLNQVLPEKHKIASLSYGTNEHMGRTELDRWTVFDLYCIGAEGERFIVEIQKAKQNYFRDRSVFYASFPIQAQALKGKWDYKLAPVYTVGILDFVFDETKNKQDLLHIIELKDQNCEVFYEKMKFIYVELPKFNKSEDELTSHFDKWLYILKHLSDLQDRPTALQEKVFKKLFEAAEIAKFTPKEQAIYADNVKNYRDLNNVVDTSRQEGRQEEKKEIAKKILVMGMSLQEIADITGLSTEEAKTL